MKRFALSVTGIAVAAVSATATSDVTLSWDITGNSYSAGGIDLLAGSSSAALASATIVSWGFSNVSADVYHNSGSSYSNWASECRLGIYDMDINNGEGDIYIWTGTPFSGQNTGDGANYTGDDFASGDVSSLGYHIGSEGDIGAGAYSTWDDGTGMAAGTFTSGTVWVTVAPVPAPGAVALLGLAGLAGRRRRRG